ncbi:MAG: hypothetical protein P8N49_02940 [Opitutales bacterium]|nr:hypothetical protein [Opitutales bacterium]
MNKKQATIPGSTPQNELLQVSDIPPREQMPTGMRCYADAVESFLATVNTEASHSVTNIPNCTLKSLSFSLRFSRAKSLRLQPKRGHSSMALNTLFLS